MGIVGSTFSEPFTPRGVAAFARGGFARLFLAQLLFLLAATGSILWFLDDSCISVVDAAVQNLPEAGEIVHGRLDWSGKTAVSLAQGRIISMDVDLAHSGAIQSTADFQVEFGRDSIRVISLLGYADFIYPEEAPFNRPDLQPLWIAWRAIVLAGVGLVTALLLLGSWWILPTLYLPPVWLFVFFTNRDLTSRQCWKLSAASLFPGALLMIAGILAYGFGLLTLIEFAFVFAAHFILSWIYLVVSLVFLPRVSSAPPRGNPFRRKK